MFFIANWKMFGDFKSVNSIKKVINFSKNKKYRKAQIIYCPPYTLINNFIKLVKKSKIKVGAQNCHYSQESGPFTGSINADLIKSSGAKYVIIGHSENRIDGDTNQIINLKIKSALKKKLKIIFCIGETLKEKRKNKTNLILNSQIKNGLKVADADRLAYYFTGLKVKPSKGDFDADKDKLSKTVKEFTAVGIESAEFFKALRYSQGWFFSTLDRELKKGAVKDNYYTMVKNLTSQPLYKKDKKSKSDFKLDKKVYKMFKKMIEGKNGAVSAYLDQLAIEQFQQATQKKVDKIKSENPDLFMESLSKVIDGYM